MLCFPTNSFFLCTERSEIQEILSPIPSFVTLSRRTLPPDDSCIFQYSKSILPQKMKNCFPWRPIIFQLLYIFRDNCYRCSYCICYPRCLEYFLHSLSLVQSVIPFHVIRLNAVWALGLSPLGQDHTRISIRPLGLEEAKLNSYPFSRSFLRE